MMNSATLIGRIGQYPKCTTSKSGQKITTFSMAIDESYRDAHGEKQERTTWIDIATFGKLAEIVEKYGRKGQLVTVQGKFSMGKYRDKDGIDRRSFGVVADTFRILEKKKE